MGPETTCPREGATTGEEYYDQCPPNDISRLREPTALNGEDEPQPNIHRPSRTTRHDKRDEREAGGGSR